MQEPEESRIVSSYDPRVTTVQPTPKTRADYVGPT